jgi:hypothetical protein
VSDASPAYGGSLSALPLQAVLVRVSNAATLERARTYLAIHAPPQAANGPGQAVTPPRTFGETIAIRSQRAELAGRLFDDAVALTILVAGCSLAVSVGGSLIDRRRPFTLLRVSGTPLGTLGRVVLLEAAVPLAAAVLLAAAIAYGMSAPCGCEPVVAGRRRWAGLGGLDRVPPGPEGAGRARSGVPGRCPGRHPVRTGDRPARDPDWSPAHRQVSGAARRRSSVVRASGR